jgi:hypothetical protein
VALSLCAPCAVLVALFFYAALGMIEETDVLRDGNESTRGNGDDYFVKGKVEHRDLVRHKSNVEVSALPFCHRFGHCAQEDFF